MFTSLHRISAGAVALCLFAASFGAGEVNGCREDRGITRVALLPPRPGNPRNSEGDFVELRDGRVLFIYTHFTGGSADHSEAHLASRVSSDGGRTWSPDDRTVVADEAGQNVMSVSLLRLDDGRIALFYLRKDSRTDCRPVLRTSTDEAASWSEPAAIIPDDQIGYYVVNNDRAVQLESGRLIVPAAQHFGPEQTEWTPSAVIVCYYSDDGGRTWRRGTPAPPARADDGSAVMLQEPGVVELEDGRLMCFCRTDAGSQYVAHSSDDGETWTDWQPSAIISPLSPASIERIPATGELLLVWNDHRDIDPELKGRRTPLTVAVSRDEGRTWERKLVLEDDPHGWYCYTAIAFVDGHVLLGHCAGDRRENNGLAETQITRFPLELLRD